MSHIQHQTNIKAICQEIADIKRQKVSDFKNMTKEQKRQYKAYRQRFMNQHINLTIVEQRIEAWANDCFEHVNLNDNGVIQREWRDTYLLPDDLPISYQ